VTTALMAGISRVPASHGAAASLLWETPGEALP
jgi:hypothetical protein